MAKRLVLLLIAALVAGAWILMRDGRRQSIVAGGSGSEATVSGGAGADTQDPVRTVVDGDGAREPGVVEDRATLLLPSFIGRVLDPDGRPLAGAVVQARGRASATPPGAPPDALAQAVSAADGRFALPEAPRDGLHYELRIRHPQTAPLALANLDSWSGRPRDLGDLRLTRGLALSGRVRDAEGKPLAGVELRAFWEPSLAAAEDALALREAILDASARSGADGSFAFARLPAARLRLRADAPGRPSVWSDALALAAEHPPAPVDLVLPEAARLRGVVASVSQQPLAGAHVRLRWRMPLLPPLDLQEEERLADDRGAFSLLLPTGWQELELRVSAAGYAASQRTLVPDALPPEPLRFELAAIPALAGVVRDARGAPVAGAHVRLLAGDAEGRHPRDREARASARSGENGGFRLLPELRAAEESFELLAWDENHGISSAQRVLLRAGAVVPAELRLLLPDGLILAGTVLAPDGAPAAGARLTLRRQLDPRGGRLGALLDAPRGAAVWARATADAAGRFRFSGLEAYDYFLEAGLPGCSPAVSEDIALVSAREDLVLRLPALCGIAGQIEGMLAALPDLQVIATAPRMGFITAEVTPEGRFAFPQLAPESWDLVLRPAVLGGGTGVSGLGGGPALGHLEDVVVLPGATTPVLLRVEMADFGRVDGTVRRNGRPAANAAVWLIADRGEPDPDPVLAALQRLGAMRRVTADADGRFACAGLEAMEWTVVLCDPGDEPAGLRGGPAGYDPRGLLRRRVPVAAGASARCDLDLRSGSLRVEMRGAASGSTPTAILLRPDPASDAGAPRTLFAGASGLRLADLPSGWWFVGPAASPDSAQRVLVPEGAEAVVTVSLPEPAHER